MRRRLETGLIAGPGLGLMLALLAGNPGAATQVSPAGAPASPETTATRATTAGGSAAGGSATLPSAEKILEAMDRNREYKTIRYSGTMSIHVGSQVRTKTMKTTGQVEGRRFLMEFTNPEDSGTRYLMLGDSLWIYFPDEDEVVRISGHMLKEGMMGSDLSYEDALESASLQETYTLSVQGEELLEGHPCYVVLLDAKVKQAPYDKRKMWVDKVTSVPWKEELYARSGKLLKISRVLEVQPIDGRAFPVRVELADQLKGNSRTVFSMSDITLNAPVPESTFSRQNLGR